MIRIIGALATVCLLTGTAALADYETCMTHCMTKDGFDYCHAICTETFDDPNNDPAASVKAVETCLLTDEEVYDLIGEFFDVHYDERYPSISQPDEDQTIFEVEWLETDEECLGVVMVTGDCEVIRYEKFHCEWTGWTQEAEAEDRIRKQQAEAEESKKKEILTNVENAVCSYIRRTYSTSISSCSEWLNDLESPEQTFYFIYSPSRNPHWACGAYVTVRVEDYHVLEVQLLAERDDVPECRL